MRKRPGLGLHTEDEQIQAVDFAADALARGLEAADGSNIFVLSKEIGYLQSIADLAMAEGVEAVAGIARANQLRLLRKFEALVGQIGATEASMGMHTKKERLEAFDMANEAYHRGVDASNEGNALGLASEVGYLTAIRELAKKEKADEVSAMVERQVSDLLQRLDRKFPDWAGGLRR